MCYIQKDDFEKFRGHVSNVVRVVGKETGAWIRFSSFKKDFEQWPYTMIGSDEAKAAAKDLISRIAETGPSKWLQAGRSPVVKTRRKNEVVKGVEEVPDWVSQAVQEEPEEPSSRVRDLDATNRFRDGISETLFYTREEIVNASFRLANVGKETGASVRFYQPTGDYDPTERGGIRIRGTAEARQRAKLDIERIMSRTAGKDKTVFYPQHLIYRASFELTEVGKATGTNLEFSYNPGQHDSDENGKIVIRGKPRGIHAAEKSVEAIMEQYVHGKRIFRKQVTHKYSEGGLTAMNEKALRSVEETLLYPPLLVSKASSDLVDLGRRSEASVRFLSFLPKDCDPGDGGKIVLRGTKDAIQAAKSSIQTIMDQYQQNTPLVRTHNQRVHKYFSTQVRKLPTERGEDPTTAEIYADSLERSSTFNRRPVVFHDDGKILRSVHDVISNVSRQESEHEAQLKASEHRPHTFAPFDESGQPSERLETSPQELGQEFSLALDQRLEDEDLDVHSNDSSRPERSEAEQNRALSGGFAWQSTSTVRPGRNGIASSQTRSYHSSSRLLQHAVSARSDHEDNNLEFDDEEPPDALEEKLSSKNSGIRAKLRKWNELHGHEEPVPDFTPKEDISHELDTYNNLTRLPDETAINRNAAQEEAQEQYLSLLGSGREGYDGATRESGRFLTPGDLVEIEYPSSERESIIAVYVRRCGSTLGQFFTMNGRWMHLDQKAAQYSISGFVNPKELEPILKYLPKVSGTADLEELKAKSMVDDLSVPRPVAAPLVRKLTGFYNEAQEIYRRHANALDNAHNILAHETDLRYGSLESAAMALLKLPADKLPITALFTVRKALANGGFAFNIDRRSHRITGYMQIRSKEQVRMVEQVRHWIRQWQDDLAITPGMNTRQADKHRPSKGARILYSFVEKSKQIVAMQRQNRQPTQSHNVGPSTTRLPLVEEKGGCVNTEMGHQFTDDEQEIIRFLEAWCCSMMFQGLPRISSMPPLILHATGLYNDIEGKEMDLTTATGFMFLQELGVVMPHENRVRFDQHLLLPSSQHSKPLQNLMSSLLAMRDNHNLRDSMSQLRRDWKDLPVYCIDDASAQEIDDGISVEKAGVGSDGQELHWLHMHIANPTAFFSRDHPLAKMARHMGETIYMPERNYMMLPRWATQRHFSLGPDRPCLTFSAKLDSQGNTLEYKVQSGTVRNVIRITYDELNNLLGATEDHGVSAIFINVNGTPPPSRAPTSRISELTEANMDDLKIIHHLSSQRSLVRKRGGGVFYSTPKPEATVWQTSKQSGLAWDHPYRKGARTVYGDPVVQLRTQPFTNWFAAATVAAQVFVSEAMLLCAEIAASFCADRNIPIIYRGSETVPVAGVGDADATRKALEAQEYLNTNQVLPLHIGLPYIQSLGYTVLRTSPLKHSMLGMERYAKVTSPLRRYGDMIIHWQIEAALRHEAETGKSMLTTDPNANRSFLPFSASILETIMLGLQPRESMIMRAKRYSEEFWQIYTMFHKFKFGHETPEGSLGDLLKSLDPCSDGETVKVFVQTRPDIDNNRNVGVHIMSLGLPVTMRRPEHCAICVEDGSVVAKQGDVWEARLKDVDVYHRQFIVEPVRLIGREML
ncbi:Mitochondrial protein cyt-4 [Pseudocercospora fuligena]|uniref:Mitochondrial protein cyt-4 n=1 Tax=Pseudocercospora fuligena TaxID=685502 RepID=A0A8H6RAY1_9PEZI|nr:Mitochondrial protein cyt-4 [Pseudocercospora fuligena]